MLKLKEQRRISQIALDDVVEGCRNLCSQVLECAESRVRAKLAESGINPDDIDGLSSTFEDLPYPFEGIETSHLQEKYFRENLGLIVSIFRSCIGSVIQCHA